jgi:Lon protease-like protein
MPLFPLGTVLFPGVVLPLHIFEDRYRRLVRDLLDGPEPRQFGVIAIRHGRETGIDGVQALYDIGCIAEVRQVEQYEDGRFDLVTVGTRRFRLADIDSADPYLIGVVEVLPQEQEDEPQAKDSVGPVHAAFMGYIEALSARSGRRVGLPELPDQPLLLSYLVAASIVVDMPDKQLLLAEPDAAHRLAAERALLTRETRMLRSLTAAPAPQLRNAPYSPN